MAAEPDLVGYRVTVPRAEAEVTLARLLDTFPEGLEEEAEGDLVHLTGFAATGEPPLLPADLAAVATPGHTSNHLCFALLEEKALFSGDHVMGWSTSVISPPDGDMTDYMRSMQLLLGRDDVVYYPAHGEPIENPQRLVRGMMGHRKQREGQILRFLERNGDSAIPDMVAEMYKGVDPRLHGAAGRSVLAHLIDLGGRGLAEPTGDGRWQMR